jgi:sugar transferase (PEP-CTERM/EpsH1 system associated)
MRVLRALGGAVSGRTCTEGYFGSAALRAALQSWTQDVHFDAILAFSGAMAPYALGLPARRRVLDLVDADSAKWMAYARASSWPMRSVYRAEGRRLEACQVQWMHSFDATVVVNGREAALLSGAAPPGRLHVIPNGVDLASELAPAGQTQPVLGFVGMMRYRPNVDAVEWFARAVWPMVRLAVPTAELCIVGRCPARRVRRLGRVPGISLTGGVPSVGPYLARFRACIAPLRIARGLQNKVLEALAAARPVVATTQAAEGLDPRPTPGVLVADQAETFAEQVIQLLVDPWLAERLGRAGQAYVARHYRWGDWLDCLEALLTGGRASRVEPAGKVAVQELRT